MADGLLPHAGRVALVTGAATGIGRAIALRLAAGGASVAVNHLPDPQSEQSAAGVVAEIGSAGGRALPAPADVADPDAVDAMIATITDELGAPTIVVANAATAVTGQRPWRELTAADWTEVLSVNVIGAFNCVHAAYPAMAASGHGSFAVLSSVTPLIGQTRNLHYVTSKAALIGFTRALAREVGVDGVRVNAIAPGAIKTPSESDYGPEDEVAATVLAVQALQRRGLPADVASVASFLCSDAASFVTGQLIVVDGGWVMH